MNSSALIDQRLWDSALRLLSRRDHSRRELGQKLQQRQFDRTQIELALDKLEARDWLSDLRFAQVQVRQHIYKKHGPIRIKIELQRKGVQADYIEQALAQEAADWFELALACYQSRFTPEVNLEFKEKAKRMRYLQSRGFNPDQIRYALESPTE